MIYMYIILWYLIGLYGFIWWESSIEDIYFDTIEIGWMLALCGPVVWVMGFFVYVDINFIFPHILIKSRRKQNEKA